MSVVELVGPVLARGSLPDMAGRYLVAAPRGGIRRDVPRRTGSTAQPARVQSLRAPPARHQHVRSEPCWRRSTASRMLTLTTRVHAIQLRHHRRDVEEQARLRDSLAPQLSTRLRRE